MQRTRSPRVLLGLCLASFLPFIPLSARAESFRDVPSRGELADAVGALSSRGIVRGYDDGTYRPNQSVKRAEAIKVLVQAKGITDWELQTMKPSPFSDVPADAWYAAHVEWARTKMLIIDGPPNTLSFHPDRTVTKAEFLKMLLLSQEQKLDSFGEIKLPLSSDSSVDAWYFPSLRLAVADGVLRPGSNGLLGPEKELSRGDVSILLYRLLRYREGVATQELLSLVETELLTTIELLNSKDVRGAEYASARALLAARGAHETHPDEPVVNGALKIAEAYRSLVRGYRALLDKKSSDAIKLSKDAWFIAGKAEEMSPSVKELTDEVQRSAASMADEARSLK